MINYLLDPSDTVRCIIYKCIQKCVQFDISVNTPLLLDQTTPYQITMLYYNTYNNIKFYNNDDNNN